MTSTACMPRRSASQKGWPQTFSRGKTMRTDEPYAGLGQEQRTTLQRLVLTFAGSLLIICLMALASFFAGSFGPTRFRADPTNAAAPLFEIKPAPDSWVIEGALSESCTCTVPCTCNFGEGPSPHHYCYSLYSYDIRRGRYGDVTLDGLHFGATELQSGRTIFIDERADARQREALRVIAARVVERLPPDVAARKAKAADPDVRYAAVSQEYDGRR